MEDMHIWSNVIDNILENFDYKLPIYICKRKDEKDLCGGLISTVFYIDRVDFSLN